MLFYLGITGLLSWIIGFFIGRIFGSANASGLLQESERRLRLREQEYTSLQAGMTSATALIQRLQAEADDLAATLHTREQRLNHLEARQQELQADLDARISELDELKAETDQEKSVLQTQLQTALTTAQTATEALKVRVAEAEGALKFSNHTERELRAQLQDKESELSQLKVRSTELELMAREVKEPAPKVALAPTSDSDDLKKVFGIGPALERLLNQHGVYWFRQIAEWSAEDVQRYDQLLEQFRGRIEREGWVASAKEQHFKKYGEQL